MIRADERKEFEKKVFTVLKTMKIIPKGYYTYPDAADLIGHQEPQWPFTIPSKVLVEFSFGKLTQEKVENVSKVWKEIEAARALIFGKQDAARLDPQVLSLIKTSGIEYFGLNDVDKLLKAKNIQASEQSAKKYRKVIEIVAPESLVDSLDELALQKIPSDMKSAIQALSPGSEIEAWKAFEDAVCAAFRSCLGFKVKQMGKESLFEHEPEAIVTPRKDQDNRYGFLYECKSAKENYHMTAKDMQTYIDYIRKKKQVVRATEGADLRYFVIVGPSFSGDKELRRVGIHSATGVSVVYLKASVLKMLAQWACEVTDPDVKGLIDLATLFSDVKGEPDESSIKGYITNFDTQNRERY